MESSNPMSGTSIQELYNRKRDNQYETINQMGQLTEEQLMPSSQHHPIYSSNNQNMQQMNQMHQMQPMQQQIPMQQIQQIRQTQQPMQPSMHSQNCNTNPYSNESYDYDKQYNSDDIEELVRDISDNLPDENVSTSDPIKDKSLHKHQPNKVPNTYFNNIPEGMRECILLLLLYMILSNGSVKLVIGKYIKQINPNPVEHDKVSTLGVFIYGILLVALFKIIKIYLLI
jgi:hypothetical protein